MRSLSLRSADTDAESSELRTMRRRFIEASRRAEVIALVTAAQDEGELGRSLTEELCEAYDAEVAFLLDCGTGEEPGRVIGTVGLQHEQGVALLRSPLCLRALKANAPMADYGRGLLGTGAKGALLASFTGKQDRRVVIGVARLDDMPFDEAETALLAGVTTSVGQALERLWAHEERDRLVEQLRQAFIGTAEALANALEAKDHDTADHARSTAELAVAVGRRLGLAGKELEDLRYEAIFHDVGKIAIPDAILNKPGPLDDEERALIQQHTVFGEQILAPVPFLSQVREIVRHAHERWDGSGYPDGLSGEQIPLGSRIVFVVDAYHEMASDRPYRASMSRADALSELRANAGTQFDPRVVEVFVAALEDGPLPPAAE
jgi:HD-GYP domain-containing protein (c-di-GMP phosphodiesterase class II)